jgi:hypothetical protein
MDDDDDTQGEDSDALHVTEVARAEAVTDDHTPNLGIPVDHQRALMVWVTQSDRDELFAVACMPDADIRQCFRRFLYRTLATLSLKDLQTG